MRVGLFVTCLVDLMRPSVGLSALKLLENAGCEVVVPTTQTCCGQPAYNSGDRRSAQALARKVLREFSDCDCVVVPSGSCGGMIKIHYLELLEESPELRPKLQHLVENVWELSDFLVNVLAVQRVPGQFHGTVTYHDCCSGLRELGVKSQPRELLAKIPGLTLKEMANPEQCCGFGGTFAVKFGDISARITDEKCADIVATGADAVVLADVGCMLSIEGRLRRGGDANTKVLHFAEILAGVTNDPS